MADFEIAMLSLLGDNNKSDQRKQLKAPARPATTHRPAVGLYTVLGAHTLTGHHKK
jgi:hypothetical protein